MAKKKSYVNKNTVGEFTQPKSIPPEIEDEILEAFTNYSLEDDMKLHHLPHFYKDLQIPNRFVIGNRRIQPAELTVEGTDIIDFDKLLLKSFQLILFRNNKDIVLQNWKLLQGDSMNTTFDFKDIQSLSNDVKSGISDPLLLDMVAVATEGEDVRVTFIDFCYTMGKLGELS